METIEKSIDDLLSLDPELKNICYYRTSKIAALYTYYHYANADESRVGEVIDSLVNFGTDQNFVINSVALSAYDDNGVDFNSVLEKEVFDVYQRLGENKLYESIKKLTSIVGGVIYNDSTNASIELIKKYHELSLKFSSENNYVIRIICDFELEPEEKIYIQQKVSEIEIPVESVSFEIVFLDDIESEISDINNPKEYVSSGTLNILRNSICFFGEEESFITVISAQSLKQLFFKYSTRGLFASNLRFYITSKKIDGKITESIKKDSANFCYYNNGIIITCDDYKLCDGQIILKDFSIVNGGQTTNLIGRSFFDNDFGVICKVIKNKYPDQQEKVTFLSKVAEASNMQKPINAKDLIANKPEQRLLKLQYAEAGMFLKIKRGEKIDKSLYPEPYMNASNDEVAQMLYSVVYQMPGTAKNSKSGILGSDKSYNVIFKTAYDSDFLKSLQYIKVAYSNWQKKLKKTEQKSSFVYSLSKNANSLMYGVLGFLMKCYTNKNVSDYLEKITNGSKGISKTNEEFKKLLKINDIGSFSMIIPEKFNDIATTALYDIFNTISNEIFNPAYTSFKRKNPTYAYSQFCKSDSYYYDYVLPVAAKKYSSLQQSLGYYFNVNESNDVKPEEVAGVSGFYDADDLNQELLNYISSIDSSKKEYKINIRQIGPIVNTFPKTLNDLIKNCDFDEDQVNLFGNDILNIVKKYNRIDDFK